MRRFELHRDIDVTGISGTGVVGEGVHFDRSSGQAVLQWRTQVRSLVIYPSIDDVLAIHGHEGKTRLVWLDD